MAQYNTNLVAPYNTNLVGQNNACLLCLQPVTNNTILRCCGRSCHINCAHTCHKPSTKRRPIFKCPSYLYRVPLAVLKISPFQPWKEDVQFAGEVKTVWKDNPLWYAPCYAIENHVTEGYCGRLLHAVDYNHLLSGSYQKRSHSKHEKLFGSTTIPNEANTTLLFELLVKGQG